MPAPKWANLHRVLRAGEAGDKSAALIFHYGGAKAIVFEGKIHLQILDMLAKSRRQPLLFHFRNGRAAFSARNQEFYQHRLIHGREIHWLVHREKIVDAVIIALVIQQIEAGMAGVGIEAFSSQKAVYFAGFKNTICLPARETAQVFIQKALKLLFVLHAQHIL